MLPRKWRFTTLIYAIRLYGYFNPFPTVSVKLTDSVIFEYQSSRDLLLLLTGTRYINKWCIIIFMNVYASCLYFILLIIYYETVTQTG